MGEQTCYLIVPRPTHIKIAPRTYVDDDGRYWARFPVHGRYTWRLLKSESGKVLSVAGGKVAKRAAIAQAQSAHTVVPADSLASLATLYVNSGCRTLKSGWRIVIPHTARI